MSEKVWWIPRESWPLFPSETFILKSGGEEKTITYRIGEDQAMALLMLEGHVIMLNSASDEPEGRCGLFVFCSDTFYPAADAEPIPAVGFGEDKEFWSLYDLVREHGYLGAVYWVALRRKLLPMFGFDEHLKEKGLWLEEMDSWEKG